MQETTSNTTEQLVEQVIQAAIAAAEQLSRIEGALKLTTCIITYEYNERSWLRTQLGLPPSVHYREQIWAWGVTSSGVFLRKTGDLSHVGPYGTFQQLSRNDLRTFRPKELRDLRATFESMPRMAALLVEHHHAYTRPV